MKHTREDLPGSSGFIVTVEDDNSRKGVKTKLMGVELIFLGTLDSMLFWRGGLVVNDFYLLLIVSGVTLYAIGAIGAIRATNRN